MLENIRIYINGIGGSFRAFFNDDEDLVLSKDGEEIGRICTDSLFTIWFEDSYYTFDIYDPYTGYTNDEVEAKVDELLETYE